MAERSNPIPPSSDVTLEVESIAAIECGGGARSGTTRSSRAPQIYASVLPPSTLLVSERLGPPMSAGGSAIANQRRIAREELSSDTMRLRMIFRLGIVVWSVFALLDVLVASSIGWQSLPYFLSIRALGIAVIVLVTLAFDPRRPLTRQQLTLLDIGGFSVITALVTSMCLVYDGISSRYAAGVMVVTMTRGSVLASHWRRGLLILGIPLLCFPLTLGLGALARAQMAAQFRNVAALSALALNVFMLLAALVVCVVGGHINWAVRRQLFASRSVGKYNLKRCIGRGGMGEVWVAYHPGLHRNVALKILHPEQDSDPVAIRRFEQEVSATSLLTHPNTVRVFDYGVTEDGIWYYAMELLDGETLGALVEREGPLPIPRALRIADQIARGLGEAHDLGIVHRDIKPENIFITHAGEEHDIVKILDFGIAKIDAVTRDHSLTRTGAIFGTPCYISPEAARGKPITAASDIYGVGALLFLMLTGAPPFSGSSPTELLLAHAEHEAPSLGSRVTLAVHPELEALVGRCLAKDPSERFSDGNRLAAGIREVRRRLC